MTSQETSNQRVIAIIETIPTPRIQDHQRLDLRASPDGGGMGASGGGCGSISVMIECIQSSRSARLNAGVCFFLRRFFSREFHPHGSHI